MFLRLRPLPRQGRPPACGVGGLPPSNPGPKEQNNAGACAHHYLGRKVQQHQNQRCFSPLERLPPLSLHQYHRSVLPDGLGLEEPCGGLLLRGLKANCRCKLGAVPYLAPPYRALPVIPRLAPPAKPCLTMPHLTQPRLDLPATPRQATPCVGTTRLVQTRLPVAGRCLALPIMRTQRRLSAAELLQ
jgi:hypothetical protein